MVSSEGALLLEGHKFLGLHASDAACALLPQWVARCCSACAHGGGREPSKCCTLCVRERCARHYSSRKSSKSSTYKHRVLESPFALPNSVAPSVLPCRSVQEYAQVSSLRSVVAPSYAALIRTMFSSLERLAAQDVKHGDRWFLP